jgi:hypothetical protein
MNTTLLPKRRALRSPVRLEDAVMDSLPALSGSAVKVYVCLASHRKWSTGRMDPSRETIRRETGIKRLDTISASIVDLERHGLITVSRRTSGGGRNSYTLSVGQQQ